MERIAFNERKKNMQGRNPHTRKRNSRVIKKLKHIFQKKKKVPYQDTDKGSRKHWNWQNNETQNSNGAVCRHYDYRANTNRLYQQM